jgi:hypothetical protein
MRKLKLELDNLAVESFATTRLGAVRRGTIRGAANTNEPWTLVIPDTGVTCTETWPSYAGPCGASIDYCVETTSEQYPTLAGGQASC